MSIETTQTQRDLGGLGLTVRVTLDDPEAAGESLARDHDVETQAQFLAGYLAGVYQRHGHEARVVGAELHALVRGSGEDVVKGMLDDLAQGYAKAWWNA